MTVKDLYVILSQLDPNARVMVVDPRGHWCDVLEVRLQPKVYDGGETREQFLLIEGAY